MTEPCYSGSPWRCTLTLAGSRSCRLMNPFSTSGWSESWSYWRASWLNWTQVHSHVLGLGWHSYCLEGWSRYRLSWSVWTQCWHSIILSHMWSAGIFCAGSDWSVCCQLLLTGCFLSWLGAEVKLACLWFNGSACLKPPLALFVSVRVCKDWKIGLQSPWSSSGLSISHSKSRPHMVWAACSWLMWCSVSETGTHFSHLANY